VIEIVEFRRERRDRGYASVAQSNAGKIVLS